MTRLLLTAPLPPVSAGSEYGWALSGDDGLTLLSQGRAPLDLLPAGAEVVLGIPAAALSWHQVTLPQGSLRGAPRLRAVLDGLLEDQLLDEPEALHFAIAPDARTGAPAWVAACNRIWLRATVQTLEAAGRRVTRIVPEFTPQPPDAAVLIFITGERDNALLTRCDAMGVISLPLGSAGLALLGGTAIDTAVVTAEPAVAEAADQAIGQRVPMVQSAQRWLQAATSPWELAQFDLAVSSRARAGKKFASVFQLLRHAPEWRAARWGIALLVLVQLAGLNAWAFRERGALEAKRTTVKTLLTQTFPSVQLVLDAPVQMAREVAALQQSTGEVAPADFEPMLSALAASLPTARPPSAIDYGTGQLRLRGLGLTEAEVPAVISALTPRGYSARAEGDLLLVQVAAPTETIRK